MVVDTAQLSLAFVAGILGFLAPCALPMLPAYISYYLNLKSELYIRFKFRVSFIFALTTLMGYLSVLVVLGSIPSVAIQVASLSEDLLNPLIGSTLIILGLFTSTRNFSFRFPNIRLIPPKARGTLSFLLFGGVYALASLSCSLPIFLLVVLQSTGVESGVQTIIYFIVYALGAGAILFPLTFSTAFSKEFLGRKLKGLIPHIQKVNSAILIIVGAYFILFTILQG